MGEQRKAEKVKAGEIVTGEEPFNFFMTLFYPADSLYVLDYNRVLKTLNGLSSAQFIERLSEHFDISPLAENASTKPAGLHHFTLLIDGTWHNMVLKASSLDTSTPIS